jgi:hypothetical protein
MNCFLNHKVPLSGFSGFSGFSLFENLSESLWRSVNAYVTKDLLIKDENIGY